MEPTAKLLALRTLKFDEAMRDMILVEKIMELMSLPRTTQRDDAQPSELAVAPKSPPAHDNCADNRLAQTRQFGERAPDFDRRNFQNFGLFRLHTRSGQHGGPL